jgi:transposase InsO family protein
MNIFRVFFLVLRTVFRRRNDLILENLALRQQLLAQQRTIKRPKLKNSDRRFWAWLSRLWPDWKSPLIMVKPETVVKWHRQRFKLYWRRKSQAGKVGRPKISQEIRDLIRQMPRENPTWGAPRIQSELTLLGFELADSTVAKYMGKPRKPPSQTWRTFLKNHAQQIAAIDFFTVPTVRFQILYCFIVLRHHRREIIVFNITRHPTACWTAHQITAAFPYDRKPRYMIRDRDNIYGKAFTDRVKTMDIDEVLIAPRSPWQNPFAERVIGSIRRECLDHFIIFNERHLYQVLRAYVEYYSNARTHLSLDRNSPVPRTTQLPSDGKVVSIPHVRGLHHHYKRVA